MAVSPWVSGTSFPPQVFCSPLLVPVSFHAKVSARLRCNFHNFPSSGQALHMGGCAWSSSSGIGPHFRVSVPVWAQYSSLPALGSLTGDVQKLQARAGGAQECARGPHCAVTFEAKVLCPSSDLEARRHVCQRLEF